MVRIWLLIISISLHAKDFVLFTEPKTGTHLLIPILQSLTGREVYWAKEYTENAPRTTKIGESDLENQELIVFSTACAPWKKSVMDQVWNINLRQGTFLHLHAPYSPVLEQYLEERNCVNFFVKRDPRDQVVSLLNHYKHIHLSDNSLETTQSDEERLLIMIERDLRRKTLQFMAWIKSPVCCALDFHKLMGAHGGAATDADALEEMRKIAAALELRVTDKELKRIYRNSFGKGWNFFKGKVGTWREYFNEKHIAAVKLAVGDLLIELGYEKDDQW